MAEKGATPDNVPRRLGRYDVVGVLAKRRSLAGSTIVIATARSLSSSPGSLENPGLSLSYSPLSPEERTTTLQRPVAIKRLAPALGRSADLLAPFLDTARAVTGIRHSNVAQIHEVGHVGDDLYLVMDYLLGETAATLMRQLHSLGETLDFTLVAHVIAEACGGLEAAHEAGILHERLTPHDLFIGYDGTIKVLDIGIAAARSRILGELGGGGLELEYASPERCKKEPLDRQSDVFSLGTMLWELNTGISPFERAKQADTIRAICEEPIVPPRNVLPDLPREVSAVTMQALARDKDKRYPTALALRDALLGAVRRVGLAGSPEEDLSRIMRRLFEKRSRDKNEMLRRIAAGTSIAGLDVGEADENAAAKAGPANKPAAPRVSRPTTPVSVTVPAKSNPPKAGEDKEPSVIIAPPSNPEILASAPVEPAPSDAATSNGDVHGSVEAAEHDAIDESGSAHVSASAPVPARPNRRGLVITWAVVALVLLLGIGLAVGLRSSQQTVVSVPTSPTPSPSPSPLATPKATEPTPLTVVSAVPGEAPAPPASSTAPSSTAPSPTTPSATAAEETVVHIETVPIHATIFVAGVKKGVAPIELRLPRSGEAVTVEIRHAGYKTLKERVVPDVNQRLKLTLLAMRGTAPTGSAPYHKFE